MLGRVDACRVDACRVDACLEDDGLEVEAFLLDALLLGDWDLEGALARLAEAPPLDAL